MAIVSRDLIKSHPQTAYCVSRIAQVEKTKPRVFAAFVKHSGLEKDHASAALSQAFASDAKRPIPTIRLENLHQPLSGWAMHPGSGHDILLGKPFVEAFEAFFEDNHSIDFINDSFDRTPKGMPKRLPYGQLATKRTDDHSNAALFLESVVLHEIVHWGRMVSLLPSGPRHALSSKPGHVSKEQGWMFVKDAYGKYLTPELLGL